MLQSYYISETINKVVRGEGYFSYFALFLLFVLLQIALRYPTTNLTMVCEAGVKSVLRERMLDKLYRMGTLSLSEERSGILSAALLDRVEALAPYYSVYIPNLAMVFLVSFGCNLYILSLDRGVGGLLFLGILGIIAVPSFTYKYLWGTGTKVWKEYEDFSADFLDNLQGMETLKNLKACEIRKNAMKELSYSIHKKTMDNMKVTTLENFLFELFATVGSLLSVAYAGYSCFKGNLPVSLLILVMFLIRSCFAPVYSLMNAWHLGYNGVSASQKIRQILSEKEPEWREAFAFEEKNSLCVQEVSFSYDGREDVLRELNFDLELGKIHAFVGKSGDGKSTLASLLAGLYPYQRGKIHLAKLSLSRENLYRWREKIGAVWQGTYLFNMSLRENLLIANPDAAEERINEAIRCANLEELVRRLPQGLDTELGEGGAMLSGGERQRVAIARCLLKNAEFLIFDEATSSLDEKNQSMIQDGLESLLKGKTSVMIAHRLSTIIGADCIFMLKGGKIIARGKHNELLETCREYKSLIESQRSLNV